MVVSLRRFGRGVALGLGLLAPLLVANTVSEPATRLEAAARADGYRRICANLLAAPLAQGETLGALLAGDAAGELAVREAVRARVAAGGFRVDGRGVGRVTVSVALDEVGAELLRDQTCAHAAALLVGLGEGAFAAVGLAEARAASENPDAPRGWENVTGRGRELAAGAAREQALETLRERLADILAGDRPGDLGKRVAAAAVLDAPTYLPCQVAVINSRVRVGEVVTDPVAAERLGAEWLAKAVEAVGYGTAPDAETYRPAARFAVIEPPPWAGRRLLATGRGADADPAEAQRAARIDALIKLGRAVDGLSLPEGLGGSVRAYIEAHPEADDVWSAYLDSARVMKTERGEGECAVTVEADLGVLWENVEVTSYK